MNKMGQHGRKITWTQNHIQFGEMGQVTWPIFYGIKRERERATIFLFMKGWKPACSFILPTKKQGLDQIDLAHYEIWPMCQKLYF